MGFDGEKVKFCATVALKLRVVFMPNHGLHAFLGFPESAHRTQSGVYSKMRSVHDLCCLRNFDGFLVSERLVDDQGFIREVV